MTVESSKIKREALKWEIAEAALADLADENKLVYEIIAYDPEGYNGTSYDRGEVVAVLRPTVSPLQPAFDANALDVPALLRKRKEKK